MPKSKKVSVRVYTNGEPDTLKGVSPVRGQTRGNLPQKCGKAPRCRAYRIAVYSYDSYMRAYIDLSALQMDDLIFDEDAKTVKVTLPSVMTEITGRDMEMRKEYENIGIMRSDLDSKERAEIKEKANASFKAEIEENPMFRQQLIASAERKARKYFEAIFEANGYTPSIDFKSNNTHVNDDK